MHSECAPISDCRTGDGVGGREPRAEWRNGGGAWHFTLIGVNYVYPFGRLQLGHPEVEVEVEVGDCRAVSEREKC